MILHERGDKATKSEPLSVNGSPFKHYENTLSRFSILTTTDCLSHHSCRKIRLSHSVSLDLHSLFTSISGTRKMLLI